MGEELYTQMDFFVHSFLTDRYNHRRVLSLVALENPSGVKNRNKKILWFSFLKEFTKVEIFMNRRQNSVDFIHTFLIIDGIFVNLLEYVKIVIGSAIDLVFKDKAV